MRPFLHASLALAAVLLATGCKDRQITAYRAPKDPAPAGLAAAPAPADASAPQTLPEGHPPINGGDAAPAGGGMRMSNVPVPTAGSANSLTWTAPATWTPKAGSSMRKGSYAVKGDGLEADLAITAFPGDTGGLHANLNRWRGQVGLPPASPAELDAAVQHLDGQGGLHFEVIDLVAPSGNPPVRMLGAITSFGGNSWFFKLTGPEPLVAAQKDAYVEFLKSVKTP